MPHLTLYDQLGDMPILGVIVGWGQGGGSEPVGSRKRGRKDQGEGIKERRSRRGDRGEEGEEVEEKGSSRREGKGGEGGEGGEGIEEKGRERSWTGKEKKGLDLHLSAVFQKDNSVLSKTDLQFKVLIMFDRFKLSVWPPFGFCLFC